MSLKDAVALVSGASGNIGRAIAPLSIFLEPVPKSSCSAEVQRNSFSRSGALNAKCHFIVADLTDSGSVGRITAHISAKGRLDVLILSSGIYERSNELTVFARQIAANVVGPYSLIQGICCLSG